MDTRKAAMMAHDLMAYHGLTAAGWFFEFDNAVTRYGQCRYRARVISLSLRLTAAEKDEGRVINTILHEIAHALSPIREGHGYVWKQKALSIGCTAERCTAGGTSLAKPWLGTCPNYKRTVTAFRRTAVSCSPCGKGTFNLLYKFVWTKNQGGK